MKLSKPMKIAAGGLALVAGYFLYKKYLAGPSVSTGKVASGTAARNGNTNVSGVTRPSAAAETNTAPGPWADGYKFPTQAQLDMGPPDTTKGIPNDLTSVLMRGIA